MTFSKHSHVSFLAALFGSCGLAFSSTGRSAVVNFVVDGGDFNVGSSWSDGQVPTNDFDSHFVQDDLTSVFTAGDTSVFQLTIGDTSRGVLNLSGGNLRVTGDNRLEVGRSAPGEGEVNLTGTSILTADGAVIGTRSRGVVNVGPEALFDLKDAENTHRDLRIGSFGPNFNPVLEPDLDGDGLVVVQGFLDASSAIISQSGARGELRLTGTGTINLVNRLWMNLCENCASTEGRLAKVSIEGSGGTFNVGGGDIFADTPTAVFSFTADNGGVTPIVAASGAEIEGATLQLDLDAYAFTPTSQLMLIDAVGGLLFGEFGSVSFLGSTTADLNYDSFNGDVYLDNFQRVAVDGDYNGNGIVDAADYTIWRDTLGSTADLRANGDNTGASMNVIDAADYSYWISRFGNTSGAASLGLTSAAVPEPATAYLLALVMASVVGARRLNIASADHQ